MPRRERRRDADHIRITTAGTSRGEDTAARQRNYLISMAIRTVCVIGAILVGPGWPMAIFLLAATVLPYVAVVVANTSSDGGDGIDLPEAPSDLHHLAGPT